MTLQELVEGRIVGVPCWSFGIADHHTTQDFRGQKKADDIIHVVLITSTVCGFRRFCVEAN